MIPAKTDLMEIARQMLLTHIMENAQLRAFQVRIERFCRVIVRLASGKLLFGMIHRIMGGEQLACLAIALKFVGYQMCTPVHKTFDVRQKISELVTIDRHGPHRAVALDRDKYSLLFSATASFVFQAMLVARFAADVLFIQFDNALQRWNQLTSRVHHPSNGMTELPGTLLRDTDPFTQIDRGDPFARIDDVVHRQEPLPQRQLGAVHGRFGGHRELPFALGTFI